MHVAVLESPRRLRPSERPLPSPSADEVLVRLGTVGICGSDVHYCQHGRIGRYVVDGPLILGHEAAGVIAEVGDGVPATRLGQRAAVEPGIPCRRCDYCRHGRYNLCADVVFLATPPVDGALAEYLKVPSDFARPVPEHLPVCAAALVEPMAVAFHAARLTHVEPGDRCLVFGGGLVGLLLAQVLRAYAAASVAVVEPDMSRRQLAEQLGVAACTPDSVAEVAPRGLIEIAGPRLPDR